MRKTFVQCWLNPGLFLSDQCKEIIHNPIIGLFTCYIIMHHSYIIYRIPYDLILLLKVLILFYSNVLQLNDSMQTFNCLLCLGAWTQKFVFFFLSLCMNITLKHPTPRKKCKEKKTIETLTTKKLTKKKN